MFKCVRLSDNMYVHTMSSLRLLPRSMRLAPLYWLMKASVSGEPCDALATTTSPSSDSEKT